MSSNNGHYIKELFRPYYKNIAFISLITLLTSVGSFITPWVTKQLIDIGIMKSNFNIVLEFVAYLILIFIFQQALSVLQFYYYRDLSVRIPYDLNYKACDHTLKVRIKYFKERNFSEVMSELFQDIANISSLTDTQFLTSFVSLFKLVAGLIALFYISWELTIIMLATIPIKLLISTFFYKKQIRIYEKIMLLQSKFSVWLSDSISGIVVIKLWGIGDKRLNKLKGILQENKTTKSRLMGCSYIDSSAGSFLSTIFTCSLYLVGALLIQQNELTIGGLISFVAYSALVFEPINIISYLITQLSTVKPAYDRFLKFLSTDIESDSSDSLKLPSSFELHHIQFQNVSLIYDQEKVLNNINFTIYSGETVAIIGPNGSGKSSIVNLILRFYEPTDGIIKINDCDIRNYDFVSYRSLLSLMAQDNYLFNDSIQNNINVTEEMTEDSIVETCKDAEAYQFIKEMPQGFNSHVGYNGSKLSGGQRQKVALARALSKEKSKILILDEATSNFDYQSEQIFNNRIINQRQYLITIIITHRPEVLKKVDKIIYIEDSNIIGIGNYDSLYCNLDRFKKFMDTAKDKENKHAIHSVPNPN